MGKYIKTTDQLAVVTPSCLPGKSLFNLIINKIINHYLMGQIYLRHIIIIVIFTSTFDKNIFLS